MSKELTYYNRCILLPWHKVSLNATTKNVNKNIKSIKINLYIPSGVDTGISNINEKLLVINFV